MAKKNKKNSKKDLGSKPVDSSVKRTLVKTRATSKTVDRKIQSTDRALVFGKENFKLVGLGLLLITLGMILMMGGFNENPAVFDEDLIYSFRRTTLAPIFILAGLVVEIFAIFK